MCGSLGAYYGNSSDTRTHLHLSLINQQAMSQTPSPQIYWRLYSSPAPVKTKTIEATAGAGAGAEAEAEGGTQCRPNK